MNTYSVIVIAAGLVLLYLGATRLKLIPKYTGLFGDTDGGVEA